MSRIIRNRAIAADDYTTLADDAPLPAMGQVIVSLQRWRAERGALAGGGLRVGVRLANTDDIALVWADVRERPLIALEWPKFADGRAFTQARLLRTRYGFAGELRAVGDVARDQMFYMRRCGIDSFAPRADQDLDGCLAALTELSDAYQPAADGVVPVWQRRRRHA
ncbi:MAG: DUF934 domain-containing protein [Nevskia sp.]|nr:DUF934 domain-containing protein [Nevskia sp.]